MNKIVHYYNENNPMGGYTFAYNTDEKYLYVGVSYCRTKIKYVRSIGAKKAEQNLQSIMNSDAYYIVNAKHLIGFKYKLSQEIKDINVFSGKPFENFLKYLNKKTEDRVIKDNVEIYTSSKYEINF